MIVEVFYVVDLISCKRKQIRNKKYPCGTIRDMTPQQTWNIIWPALNGRYKRTATYLTHRNAWELLVSVILSAQTTDEMVNKVTPDLFKKYPTPQALAKATIPEITKYIKKIGYYNSKAKYIKQTAELVVTHFKGKVPLNEIDLRTLPGVGRKTAMVVLSHVGKDKNIGIPVDTHVIRFAHRFKLSRSNNPDKIELDLQAIIPKAHWKRAAYAIKQYGRAEGRARPYDPSIDPLQIALRAKK